MNPTDLLRVEAWADFERELARRSGLTTVVYDADNARVTDTQTWANELCPLVKEDPDAASQICAVAQQNLLAAAVRTRRPIVEECDAGMVKIVMPIFVGDDLVGSVSGCGQFLPDSELEVEYLVQSTGMSEDGVRRLGESVRRISEEEARAHADYVFERVQEIVARSR